MSYLNLSNNEYLSLSIYLYICKEALPTILSQRDASDVGLMEIVLLLTRWVLRTAVGDWQHDFYPGFPFWSEFLAFGVDGEHTQ